MSRHAPALLALALFVGVAPGLVAAPAFAEPPPTRAALRKAFEANRDTVVEVVGPRRKGTGVLVGRTGQVLTSVDFVGLDAARVRRDGQERAARVLLANAALRIAVVEIDPPGEYPATAVQLNQPPAVGDWVVAISRTKKGAVSPVLGQVMRAPSERSAFLEVQGGAMSPGTPLFDARGKLVAVVVGSGGGRARALPVPAIKERLAMESRP
ncbi:MAG TPA: serine protease [Myxococcaceae bacterium]|nr:serine protease [Myxococcaceae bacterium]